jgi:hypothetical protein
MAGEMLYVKVEGVEQVKAALGAAFTPEARRRMMLEIGYAVQQRTADHIAKASVSRHKTADRLGAPHSGFLEFAPGRVRSEGRFPHEDGKRGFIEPRNATESSVDIIIGNTPGLSRAFHDLVITPKEKKALTIPINAVSYAKSVKKVKAEGYRIHREGRVLKGGKGGGETIPLYVLCGRVTVPQDRGLLPLEEKVALWAARAAKRFADT